MSQSPVACLMHESLCVMTIFTRMSVNSPTTSYEIGCGQSVSDETCVKVDLIWLIDWTK